MNAKQRRKSCSYNDGETDSGLHVSAAFFLGNCIEKVDDDDGGRGGEGGEDRNRVRMGYII